MSDGGGMTTAERAIVAMMQEALLAKIVNREVLKRLIREIKRGDHMFRKRWEPQTAEDDAAVEATIRKIA